MVAAYVNLAAVRFKVVIVHSDMLALMRPEVTFCATMCCDSDLYNYCCATMWPPIQLYNNAGCLPCRQIATAWRTLSSKMYRDVLINDVKLLRTSRLRFDSGQRPTYMPIRRPALHSTEGSFRDNGAEAIWSRLFNKPSSYLDLECAEFYPQGTEITSRCGAKVHV